MERLAKIAFVIGLIVYFVFLVVVRTPAQWGAWAALQASPNLSISGVSGTLWSGKASTAQVNLGTETLDLGTLSWRLDAWKLLLLQACVDVDSTMVRGYVCRSLGGKNSAKNVLVDQVPMKLLDNVIGAQLGGVGNLTVEQGTFADNGRIDQLKGNVTWQHARINAGTGWFALGSYAADITGNDKGGIAGNIFDLEGNFSVQLQGDYTPGEQPRLNGIIKPKEGAEQPLIDALSVFTETQDDGSFRVTWPMGG